MIADDSGGEHPGSPAHDRSDDAARDAATPPLFDAHLDLAYLELRRRNMLRPLDRLRDDERGPHPPAAVTLPELALANVRYALGTVFTRAGTPDDAGDPDTTPAEAFDPHDVESAHDAGVKQLDVYERWAGQGVCSLSVHGSFEDVATGESTSAAQTPVGLPSGEAPTLKVGILVENADPIRTPDELPFWIERGVVAISLTWATYGRYAAGNDCLGEGSELTGMGVAMLDAMEQEQLVLDVSHLSDRSLHGALERFGGRVIASHSNCRAIAAVGDARRDQRHLTDETIREIGRRDGVIGLNLCAGFVAPNAGPDDRPSIDQACSHVERVCELTGSTRHVGLGSDLDGGFSARALPAGIDRARDLGMLLERLRGRGFGAGDLRAFASENWLRVMSRD